MTKILFTGASSFTGYWFIKELSSLGYDVTALFTKPTVEAYEPLRQARISEILKISRPVFGLRFGDDKFLKLIKTSKFDIICHHASEVSNYKSPDFSVSGAVESNTHKASQVFSDLKSSSCNHFLLTGSVFEGGEGASPNNSNHFSPYGLSKSITSQIFHYYAEQFQISIGKFVIPNPFGAFEEKRFINYLISQWLKNEIPQINTPLYIRDNIHVKLLAKYYSFFLKRLLTEDESAMKISPSGYIESQGDFAKRVATEMQLRLGHVCDIRFNTQTIFDEPLERVNTDSVLSVAEKFDEKEAWDELASYYLNGSKLY